MSSDQEKSSSDLKRPDISWLVAWGGAFTFACMLVACTLKRSKKIRAVKKSRDDDSNLECTGYADEAQPVKGLQLLLQSSSTDLISRSCYTISEMLINFVSKEDSNFDENRTPTTKPILEKNKDEKVANIYEEEYPNSEKSVENEALKSDESSKVLEGTFRVLDEATWLTEWIDEPSSSSSSSSSSASEETFLFEFFWRKSREVTKSWI